MEFAVYFNQIPVFFEKWNFGAGILVSGFPFFLEFPMSLLKSARNRDSIYRRVKNGERGWFQGIWKSTQEARPPGASSHCLARRIVWCGRSLQQMLLSKTLTDGAHICLYQIENISMLLCSKQAFIWYYSHLSTINFKFLGCTLTLMSTKCISTKNTVTTSAILLFIMNIIKKYKESWLFFHFNVN